MNITKTSIRQLSLLVFCLLSSSLLSAASVGSEREKAPREPQKTELVEMKQNAGYTFKSRILNQKNSKLDAVTFVKMGKFPPHVSKYYASIEIRYVPLGQKNKQEKLILRLKRNEMTDAFVNALASCQMYQRRFDDLKISSAGYKELYFLDNEGKPIATFQNLVDFLDCFSDEKGQMRSIVDEFLSCHSNACHKMEK